MIFLYGVISSPDPATSVQPFSQRILHIDETGKISYYHIKSNSLPFNKIVSYHGVELAGYFPDIMKCSSSSLCFDVLFYTLFDCLPFVAQNVCLAL